MERPSPYTINPEEYLDVVWDCLARVQDGGNTPNSISKIHEVYQKLDPITTLGLHGEPARDMLRGLSSATFIVSLASMGKDGRSGFGHRSIDDFARLQTDTLSMMAQVQDPHILALGEEKATSAESFMRKRLREVHKPDQAFNCTSMDRMLDVLNVSALRIRIGAEYEKNNNPGTAKSATMKRVGRLALTSMQVVAQMAGELDLREKQWGNVPPTGSYSLGRMGELLCFSEQLLEWRESGRDDSVARLALEREDQNEHAGRCGLRRTFDLVNLAGEPVQIKSGHTEKRPYAPEIKMCYVTERCGAQAAKGLLGLMKGAVYSSSFQQRTKFASRLQDYFSEVIKYSR